MRSSSVLRKAGENRTAPNPPPASLTLTFLDGAGSYFADALFQEALVDLGHLGAVGAQDGDALWLDGAI